ncbi:hypothetical protein [Fibrobacter sp.]|uniref:hypothetical protein n=1 Tax=Fibrobacter sp. TaxID=35828 RepID=UPI0038672337
MFVKSTATLVPCVTVSHSGDIMFHVFSSSDDKFVEFHGDKYYKKGEFHSDNDKPTNVPLFLTDDEDIRKVAKEFMRSRPEPFGRDVAAVMLRDKGTTNIHWFSVSNKGTIKLFGNADPIDITNMEEGETYSGTKTQIFFSPITAIRTVRDYLVGVCNEIIAESTEREAKEQQEILNAKSFIDKLHQAQEI